MQICDCDVRLSGDQLHRVRKRVTVAEIYVLRQLHGADAVVNITPVKQDKRSHQEEIERLRRKYRRPIQNINPNGSGNIVDSLFGGPSPNVPVNLADIGVEHPSKGSSRKSKGSSSKAASGDADAAAGGASDEADGDS